MTSAHAGPAGALAAVLALVAAAAGAGAAVTLRSDSTLLVGVQPPPVGFEAGPGAERARHVSGFALSPDGTSLTVTMKPKPGASMNVKDLAFVLNRDDAPRTVSFRAAQVPNASVEAFTWTVRDGNAVVAVFNQKAASPTATFTLPAGARFSVDVRVDLAEGAGRHDAAVTTGLGMEVA